MPSIMGRYDMRPARTRLPSLRARKRVGMTSCYRMRLTERSQDALRLAKSESEAMGHDHVGTRHLLVGLLAEQGGVAGSVLRSFGFEVEDV